MNQQELTNLLQRLISLPKENEYVEFKDSNPQYELAYAKEKVSDADVVALLHTDAVFDLLLKMPYPSTRSKVIEKLIDEKLIVQSNGYFHITNLGALLFAKDLRKFDLERKAPRVIKYAGKNKLYTEKDQIETLGYSYSFIKLVRI